MHTTAELRAAGINVQDGDNLPTLRRGSRGDAVKQLQVMLNEQTGAGLNQDGIFGAKTESAVRHLQELRNLRDDGIVGPKTWAALGTNDGNVNPPIGNGNNEITPSEPPEDKPPFDENPEPDATGVWLPMDQWNNIKAAVAVLVHTIKINE